jgi:hypothetical protein
VVAIGKVNGNSCDPALLIMRASTGIYRDDRGLEHQLTVTIKPDAATVRVDTDDFIAPMALRL